MINNFPAFAKIVAASFQGIVSSPNVFVVDIEGDALYEKYLSSFPEGTNPIFKEKTEHDCSCCKQFIRHVGMTVGIGPSGKKLSTVWDKAAKEAPHPYNEVAKVLQEMVQSSAIKDIFRVSKKEGSFGAEKTLSGGAILGTKVLTWNHFYTGPIPKNLQVESPGQVCGDYKTTVQVYVRGLSELTPEAVSTVASIAQDNTLYRGAEHLPAILQFQKAQREYRKLEGHEAHLFVWSNANGPASRFRNTVIGTLVQDLSDGVDIERAVGSFESKVAPQNYKRTTALITPMMVAKAMETVKSLDLEPALERRFAKIDDISINDVLWVDSGVKPLMKGGLEGMLLKHTSSLKKDTEEDEKKAEDIGMDDFVKTVLPEATSMELLLKGAHLGNLMSLTAPVHAEPKQLFRWTNDFAWSYGGNVTDSIKERVKKAGGNVTNAKLRVSLSWFNTDDLDLHLVEPGGNEIYFGNKKGKYGQLDVDMNAGGGLTRTPVENIAFVEVVDGAYRVIVNNFNLRERDNLGFVVEVENAGKLSHFSYQAGVRSRENVAVATLHVKNGVVVSVTGIGAGLTTSAVSQEKWGLTTEKYVKVNAVTLSPNYWGGNAVGNKHTFFVLDGAKNDEPTRGIYNEFLHPRLEQHRKVFEVIGEKTKCQPTDGQLSGVGFSSTKQDSVIVKVMSGKKQRLFNIKVGTDISTLTGVTNERQLHV